jgi:hypothetical protein
MAKSNKKSQNQLRDRFKRLEKQYLLWIKKINELRQEIKALEELQGNRIIKASALSIAVFLLKSQIIEFELKQIIPLLDQEIRNKLLNINSDVSRRIRSPKNFNNFTLGKIIVLFCEFDGMVPEALRNDLGLLKKLRNDFTHKLFERGKNIEDLRQDAIRGIKLSSKVLNYIEIMRKELNKRRLEEFREKISKQSKVVSKVARKNGKL